MKVDFLTLFPDMIEVALNTSILKRSQEKGKVEFNVIDIRDFSTNKHNKVDDYPFGGGQGMILQCEPVINAIKSVKKESSVVVMMTPQGKTLTQQIAYDFRDKYEHVIILAGHYEGFDERIRDYVDFEISIGDYVLTGGELAGLVLVDAITRLVSGVVKDASHEDDSFASGLLEYPQYTRPREFEGKEVPEVLLSGDHAKVEQYRKYESLKKTYLRRPDLLDKKNLTKDEANMLQDIKNNIKLK